MRRLKSCLFAAIALWAVGCSSPGDIESVKREVTHFQTDADAGRFDQMYDGADGFYRRSITRDVSRRFFEGVHRRFGPLVESKLLEWKVKQFSAGTFVNVRYFSKFRHGNAAEDFTWRMIGRKPLLAGYHFEEQTFIPN